MYTLAVQFFYSWPPSGGRHEDPLQPLETAVIGDGWRGEGLSAVPPSPKLIGRVAWRGGGGTPWCMLHLHHLEPWISLLPPPFACFLSSLLPPSRSQARRGSIKNPPSECGTMFNVFFTTVKSPNVVWGLYVVIGNNKILFGPAQFICKSRRFFQKRSLHDIIFWFDFLSCRFWIC